MVFREYGIVEFRACFFAKEPIIIKSVIFSDERRGVFGIRFLGERGPGDLRLIEMSLPAVKRVIAVREGVKISTFKTWNGDGKKREMFLNLVARDGNLVIAEAGHIDRAPAWMRLADVRKVL